MSVYTNGHRYPALDDQPEHPADHQQHIHDRECFREYAHSEHPADARDTRHGLAYAHLYQKKAAGQMCKYFLDQQKNLGAVNGYIEEMMNGQKVVKVFCHEDASIREFHELNDALYTSADRAKTLHNI